jgi:hypothetical protein
MNLGAYALLSAIAVGGAVAGQQYGTQPSGPQQDQSTAQQQGLESQTQQQNGYSSTPMGSTPGVVDCNTLITHHQQMMTELDKMDQELDTRLSQMRDAKSDRARIDATMGVVESLAMQRKQIRDRMSMMEHETLQFMLSNKGTDLTTSCPQLTQLLQKGAMPGNTTDDAIQQQGGPDDMEFGNDQRQAQPQQAPQPPQQR